MQLKAVLAAVITLASTSNALSTLQVSNFCDEDIYLTVAGEGPSFGPVVLATAVAWLTNITGKGNTATITKTNDIFAAETAKLILGTSSSDGILYWYDTLMSLLLRCKLI